MQIKYFTIKLNDFRVHSEEICDPERTREVDVVRGEEVEHTWVGRSGGC